MASVNTKKITSALEEFMKDREIVAVKGGKFIMRHTNKLEGELRVFILCISCHGDGCSWCMYSGFPGRLERVTPR